MLIDHTRKALTELRGTQLGYFVGVVREVRADLIWISLFCGERWAFVPRHLAPGAQLGEEMQLHCWETEHGICAKPLTSPLREGHTRRAA